MTIEEFNNINKGELVVYCNYDKRILQLTLNNRYFISYVNKEYNYFTIIDDSNYSGFYNYSLFMTLQEYEILHRKDKIKKIWNT
jgi:hypothetical protein